MVYEKQEWINNETAADENKMNHIEDGIFNNSVDITDLKNRNVITAGLSASITISTTGENTIALDSIKTRLGTGFTVSNGKVYVGAGINYVMVSGSVYSNRSSAAGTACNTYLKKNGSSIIVSTNSFASGQSNHTVTTPWRLEAVNEGDYFELAYYGYSGDVVSSYATILTIEAVA